MRIWVSLCVALGAGSACSSEAPEPVVAPDFVGVLVAADLAQWQVEPSGPDGLENLGNGGPDSYLLVGPATFELADGTTLEVPPRTPGGNLCELLGAGESPDDVACLVAGGVDAGGEVAWFAVEQVPVFEGSGVHLSIDRYEGRDAIVRIGGVLLPVPIRDDALLDCSATGGDLTTIPVRVPAAGAEAELNAAFEVVRIECLYDY